MNKEKLDFYKSKLEEEKSLLEKQLDSRGRRLKGDGDIDWVAKPEEDDGFRADQNENADDVEDFEANVAVLTELEQQHVSVVKALQRLAEDSYGKCESCNVEIDEERLNAFPNATTCTEHKA